MRFCDILTRVKELHIPVSHTMERVNYTSYIDPENVKVEWVILFAIASVFNSI